MKEGGRGGTGSIRQRHLRNALVIAEVALALVLLVGAGLLIRSFWKLQNADPGFKSDHVLTAKFSLPRARYEDRKKLVAFQEQLLERIAFEARGYLLLAPHLISPGLDTMRIWGSRSKGEMSPDNDGPEADHRFVTPDYFEDRSAFRLSADASVRERIERALLAMILVNKKLADTYFPGEEARANG